MTKNVCIEQNLTWWLICKDISPIIPNVSRVKHIVPDIILKHYDLDIGIGEFKHLNSSTDQIEEDRIRIAELLKRLLHIRISKAKHIDEFIVFETMVFGEQIKNGFVLYQKLILWRWNYWILHNKMCRAIIYMLSTQGLNPSRIAYYLYSYVAFIGVSVSIQDESFVFFLIQR